MTKCEGANRVAEGFAATGGPTAGAEAVEELLDWRRSNSRQKLPPTELASF